jgi:hypothetical protein
MAAIYHLIDKEKNIMSNVLHLDLSRVIARQVDAGAIQSLHKAGEKAGVSWPTVFGWNKSPKAGKVSIRSLSLFLTDGLGIDREELMQMTLADLFVMQDEFEPEPTDEPLPVVE